MTTFLRLLAEPDKATALAESCARLRSGSSDPRLFGLQPTAFDAVPGKPFAYWVSEAVRETFRRLPALESEGRTVKQGLATADDFRFVRAWWETPSYPVLLPEEDGSLSHSPSWREFRVRTQRWLPFAKGGAYSPFYADIHLVIDWKDSGQILKARVIQEHGNAGKRIYNEEHYLRPGLTWPRRTQGGLSLRAMPSGCIFADKGPAAFVANDDTNTLLALLALTNSRAFALLVSLHMAFGSYEVGVIQKTPVPDLSAEQQTTLAALARRAWSLKRKLDTIEEASHAFLLPAALLHRLGDYAPPAIEAELDRIQAEIDAIAFDLYGFSAADRAAAQPCQALAMEGDAEASGQDDDQDEEDQATPIDQTAGLRCWAVGVAFGRFDWRLATGERVAPPEPEPFDPLPAKSPGMLPDGNAPFHVHPGLLVDDPGHPHDLTRLVEEVLAAVDVTVPDEVRRWQRKDFFPFHLQRYSKSRRKAPIYWPLATASGSYTLWLFYPRLTSQTLYTALNDFVEPKLKQVAADLTALRNKGTARTRDDERRFEALQAFDSELIELRDTLLKLAPSYHPNHDDGVQINAAPLWPLFRHKPWQKVLKDTWAKLEKGDYDWAHLAMNYWPERVREKCRIDKSLAIAHGLEDLYVEPEAAAKKTRGKKKAG